MKAGVFAVAVFAAVSSASAAVRVGTFLTQVAGVAREEGISLAEAAARAKALGIEGFDAGMDERASIPALIGAGLKPGALYGTFHLERSDESARLEEYLRTAEEFGFRTLLIIPGEYLRGGRKDSSVERRQAMDAITSRLKAFVAKAKARGLAVTVEDFDDVASPCSIGSGLKALFDAIPDLGFTFDTGNVTYTGDDTMRLFETWRGRIRHVHLKDRVASAAEEDRIWGEPCEVGRGVKPIAEIVRRLVEEGYDGWLVEEHFASKRQWADMTGSMRYVNGLLREGRPSDRTLAKMVAADVARPVRPALVDGQPFWNEKARFFMYPPSFAFTNVAGAARYRYRVTDDRFGEYAFETNVPTATLDPVWASVPAGWVKVEVEALDAKGAACGRAGARRFWKSAPYSPGSYPKPEISIAECLDAYFGWLCGMKNTRLIRETGEGDPDYYHNCYPAKMYAALARGFVRYAETCPGRRDELLLTARRCCDHLISISYPKGSPLEFFAPTYSGTRMAAEQYAGMNMLIYAADAGLAYLAVHGATKEVKYLDAAERTAATYLRLQGKDGTWYLKLYEKDGSPVCENRLFPMRVIEFLEELFRRTGKEAYRAAADRAFAFIEKGPLADWNWEGQFEDVKPSAPYQNLTKHSPCETAIYLVRRFPGDKAALAKARELLRFAEDQFVCWELPARADFSSGPLDLNGRGTGVRYWRILPAALEQYGWYVPIDASNAKLIRTYLALYRAEGNPLDLEKARTLGESIVRAQTAVGTGSIPTQWLEWDMHPKSEPWINCSIAAALALMELDCD